MSSAQPVANSPRKYQLMIDGQWIDAESGKTFTTPNPSTGETLAEVAEADKADIDKAVTAARLGVRLFAMIGQSTHTDSATTRKTNDMPIRIRPLGTKKFGPGTRTASDSAGMSEKTRPRTMPRMPAAPRASAA